MHPYQLTINITAPEGSNVPVPEPLSISGSLGDDEWGLLNRFNDRVIELLQARFVQSGMPASLNIKMESETLSYSTQLPDSDDLAAFLHRFRPFFLASEETNFDKICDLIKVRLASPIISSMVSEQQSTYHGEMFQSWMTVRLISKNAVTHSSDEYIVNSDELLKKWLYSSEYHFDKNKRELIESFEKIMPLEAQKSIFIQLLGEKVEAISSIASLVRVILGLEMESTGRIRQDSFSEN